MHVLTIATNNEIQFLLGRDRDDFLHFAESGDGRAVNADDDIASFEAGRCAGAAGQHNANARLQHDPAIDVENGCQQCDGEDKIGEGAGEDDRRTRP